MAGFRFDLDLAGFRFDLDLVAGSLARPTALAGARTGVVPCHPGDAIATSWTSSQGGPCRTRGKV